MGTEAMAYMVSGTMDRGYEDYQLEAAISKVFASEAAWFVTDEGIQILGGMGYMKDAGGHLKELQRAVQDPISNFGVVLGEVAKRGRSAIGISSGNMLGAHVHPNLVDHAGALCANVEAFGGAIEKLLIKHGKNIIHEQFLLNRIAQASIDIYAMSCVLSRCTVSLNQAAASARHEELITKTFCDEANRRVEANLNTLRDPVQLQGFKNMVEISEGVCENNEPISRRPLGV